MLKETMLSLPGRFRPKLAGNFRATIQFNFSGEEASHWVLTIGDGRCTVAEGMVETPDATVVMAAADFIGINNGDIPAPEIFWGGRIDIEGDVEAVIGLAPVMGW
jgi:putative sterol carrier protein